MSHSKFEFWYQILKAFAAQLSHEQKDFTGKEKDRAQKDLQYRQQECFSDKQRKNVSVYASTSTFTRNYRVNDFMPSLALTAERK